MEATGISSVIWDTEAVVQLEQMFDYLIEHFSAKTVVNFADKIEKVVLKIQKHPTIGRPSLRYADRRSYQIDNRRRIYYEFDEYTLYIIGIFDNRQDPQKNKFQ